MLSRLILKTIKNKVCEVFDEPYAYRILNLYPEKTNEEVKCNWSEIYSSVLFSYGHYCWERQVNDNNIPVYTYIVTKDNGLLGAWHCGNIETVIKNL